MTPPGNQPGATRPIAVSCALIEHKGNVLIALRKHSGSNAGKWEFPGGKQEAGESPEECLQREIREELSIDIIITDKLPDVVYVYPGKTIKLMPFICRHTGQEIHCNEHERVLWVSPAAFKKHQWSEADILVWKHYLHFRDAGTDLF